MADEKRDLTTASGSCAEGPPIQGPGQEWNWTPACPSAERDEPDYGVASSRNQQCTKICQAFFPQSGFLLFDSHGM